MVKEANAQELYINAWEDHILIQPAGNCDRYYTLTRMVFINGCNVYVNDHLFLELMYYQSLTLQGAFELFMAINKQMKASKRV
jgi:hypothetical protein